MFTLLVSVLATSFAIMLASLSGVIFTWKTIGDWLRPRLHVMVAFAMGIFLVIIYGLAEEVTHEGITTAMFIAFLCGGILLELATRILPKDSHHHHHGSCEHAATMIDARRVLAGDAIHNIHDGLILVPAFLVSPVVGFGTAFGIFLHEIVQEIAEFFILRSAGYTTKRALILNFAVSSTILIGIILSWWLASTFEIGHLLVAVSAGGFTYVIIRDIAPSIVKEAHRSKKYYSYLFAIGVGVVVMLTITLLLPEHHERYEDEYPLPEGFGLVLKAVNPEMG